MDARRAAREPGAAITRQPQGLAHIYLILLTVSLCGLLGTRKRTYDRATPAGSADPGIELEAAPSGNSFCGIKSMPYKGVCDNTSPKPIQAMTSRQVSYSLRKSSPSLCGMQRRT